MRIPAFALLFTLAGCSRPDAAPPPVTGGGPVAAAPATNRPVAETLVTAELLSSQDDIAPGEMFELGVNLKIAPGWHIYWENPGESGLRTKASLESPGGFLAAPFRFPGPVRFEGMGVVGYGYEKETLLVARITAPKELAAGTTSRFTAQVSWLACKESCVPGKKSLALDLPAVAPRATAPPGAGAAAIARFKRFLPQEHSTLPGAAVNRSSSPDGGVEIVLRVPTTAALEFFPGPSESYELASRRVEDGDGTRGLRLAFRKLEGSPPPRMGEPGGLFRVAEGESASYYTTAGVQPVQVPSN